MFPPLDPAAPPGFPSAGAPRFAEPIRGRLSCGGHACRYAALALGDLDRDGLRDVVAGARDVQVFFGIGDGTFARGATLSTPGFQAGDLRLAELNGDRRPDVVVGASDGSVSVIPTACRCRAPFSGPVCETCERDPTCPGGAAEQLAVGPAAIVPLGAQLAARSLTPPADARSAARFAQQLAALGLESDVVVVAQPLRDRNELFPNGDSSVPFTITSFAVERVLIGPGGLQEFEIAQEGGAVGDLVVENPNAVPFPNVDDLAICPEASEAGTSVHWLLFLTALGGDRSGANRLRSARRPHAARPPGRGGGRTVRAARSGQRNLPDRRRHRRRARRDQLMRRAAALCCALLGAGVFASRAAAYCYYNSLPWQRDGDVLGAIPVYLDFGPVGDLKRTGLSEATLISYTMAVLEEHNRSAVTAPRLYFAGVRRPNHRVTVTNLPEGAGIHIRAALCSTDDEDANQNGTFDDDPGATAVVNRGGAGENKALLRVRTMLDSQGQLCPSFRAVEHAGRAGYRRRHRSLRRAVSRGLQPVEGLLHPFQGLQGRRPARDAARHWPEPPPARQL